MCTSKEFKEMKETFKQLPDSYQQSIISVIRHRKALYDMQLTVEGMRQTYETNRLKIRL